MSRNLCRIGDQVQGTCRVNAPGHPRAFTGTWNTGSSNITADGIGIVRVDDTGTTDCGHTFKAIEGAEWSSDTNGKKLHRVGDAVEVIGGGEGISVTGSNICRSI